MSEIPSGALLLRIAALAVFVVFFQIGVVSEVPIFGVNADLTPLLVAFVGLLCGSMLGAVGGFAVGLLVDLALLQTLGLTSLVFTMIGYWSDACANCVTHRPRLPRCSSAREPRRWPSWATR